jgi:hypothetical protein
VAFSFEKSVVYQKAVDFGVIVTGASESIGAGITEAFLDLLA